MTKQMMKTLEEVEKLHQQAHKVKLAIDKLGDEERQSISVVCSGGHEFDELGWTHIMGNMDVCRQMSSRALEMIDLHSHSAIRRLLAQIKTFVR